MPDNQKDEAQDEEEEEDEEEESSGIGRFFQKVPSDILLSPGGIVLLFFALIMEILDIVIPDGVGLTYTLELIPEVIFMVLLKIIAGVSFLSMIIPLVIEKIPIVSDIVPSFFIKMLI